MRSLQRWLGNPSLQFFVVFVFAPIFAIAGEATGGRGSVAELAGWLITCLLIGLAAARSFRHERKQLPPGPLFSGLKLRHNPTMLRYLAAVATVGLFATAGALVLIVAILVRLIASP